MGAHQIVLSDYPLGWLARTVPKAFSRN
jgi:hypothetical protein